MATLTDMAHPSHAIANSVLVKTNRQLPQVTEAELPTVASQICADADQGIQTAIMSNDGKTVRSIVGLNGCRYLPDPDPDPLDEMLNMILDEVRKAGT